MNIDWSIWWFIPAIALFAIGMVLFMRWTGKKVSRQTKRYDATEKVLNKSHFLLQQEEGRFFSTSPQTGMTTLLMRLDEAGKTVKFQVHKTRTYYNTLAEPQQTTIQIFFRDYNRGNLSHLDCDLSNFVENPEKFLRANLLFVVITCSREAREVQVRGAQAA